MAEITLLVVKVGAIALILFPPTQYAHRLQRLGGLWIVQALLAVAHGTPRGLSSPDPQVPSPGSAAAPADLVERQRRVAARTLDAIGIAIVGGDPTGQDFDIGLPVDLVPEELGLALELILRDVGMPGLRSAVAAVTPFVATPL